MIIESLYVMESSEDSDPDNNLKSEILNDQFKIARDEDFLWSRKLNSDTSGTSGISGKVLFFYRDDVYEKTSDKTHGQFSHAIKHFREFNSGYGPLLSTVFDLVLKWFSKDIFMNNVFISIKTSPVLEDFILTKDEYIGPIKSIWSSVALDPSTDIIEKTEENMDEWIFLTDNDTMHYLDVAFDIENTCRPLVCDGYHNKNHSFESFISNLKTSLGKSAVYLELIDEFILKYKQEIIEIFSKKLHSVINEQFGVLSFNTLDRINDKLFIEGSGALFSVEKELFKSFKGYVTSYVQSSKQSLYKVVEGLVENDGTSVNLDEVTSMDLLYQILSGDIQNPKINFKYVYFTGSRRESQGVYFFGYSLELETGYFTVSTRSEENVIDFVQLVSSFVLESEKPKKKQRYGSYICALKNHLNSQNIRLRSSLYNFLNDSKIATRFNINCK